MKSLIAICMLASPMAFAFADTYRCTDLSTQAGLVVYLPSSTAEGETITIRDGSGVTNLPANTKVQITPRSGDNESFFMTLTYDAKTRDLSCTTDMY